MYLCGTAGDKSSSAFSRKKKKNQQFISSLFSVEAIIQVWFLHSFTHSYTHSHTSIVDLHPFAKGVFYREQSSTNQLHMDLYSHTVVSKCRYIQYCSSESSVHCGLFVDSSATVQQAGWLHNEPIQNKTSDSNSIFGSKAKSGNPLYFTPPSCSIVPFVCFLHLRSVHLPYVRYFFPM